MTKITVFANNNERGLERGITGFGTTLNVPTYIITNIILCMYLGVKMNATTYLSTPKIVLFLVSTLVNSSLRRYFSILT